MYVPLKITLSSSDNTVITTFARIQAAHLTVGYGITLQNSRTPHKAYVWDVNHFPLQTQYSYRFTILLAGAQGLYAHSV